MAVILRVCRAAGLAALTLAVGTAPTFAQDAVSSPTVIPVAEDSAEAVPQLPAPSREIAAGTLIEIQIEEAVNSKTHKTGDWYAISLAQPIMLGDATLVPAGTPGRGQVVHSAKSGWGGKAGELILAARYLEFGSHRIPLRGMKLGGVGANNEGLAFGATVAGGVVAMPLVFVLTGKNADIPAGMLATAKLAEALPAEIPVDPEASNGEMAAGLPQPAPVPAVHTSSTTEKGEPKP